MRLEGQIASAEDGIQQAIHERARQIARLLYVFVMRNHEHSPRRARPVDQILARLYRMLALHERIEDLAQRRAASIKRELDNTPSVSMLRIAPPLPHARWGQTHNVSSSSRFPPPVHCTGGGGSARLRAETEGAATPVARPSIPSQYEIAPPRTHLRERVRAPTSSTPASPTSRSRHPPPAPSRPTPETHPPPPSHGYECPRR
jgi:hypothetical protein